MIFAREPEDRNVLAARLNRRVLGLANGGSDLQKREQRTAEERHLLSRDNGRCTSAVMLDVLASSLCSTELLGLFEQQACQALAVIGREFRRVLGPTESVRLRRIPLPQQCTISSRRRVQKVTQKRARAWHRRVGITLNFHAPRLRLFEPRACWMRHPGARCKS